MAVQERFSKTTSAVRKVLGPDGSVVGQEPDLTPDQLAEVYRRMVLLRVHDQRSLTLQRQGRMGTFAPFTGQEAAQVGSTYPLAPQDWIFPTYRDHGAMIVRGTPIVNIMRYFMGDERGNAVPEGVNVFPISIPIATQCLHAVGAGWAARLKGDPVVTVCYFGDGGTSPGDFHEAMNFAGVFKTPTIFFCQNNLYAISVPLHRQTSSGTIAQKAMAYDIPSIRVDGQDVMAVIDVVQEAADRARQGEGATLIEALTYRYGPHTTSDDPKRYRREDEVAEWQGRDPLERLRRYCLDRGFFTPAEEETCWEEAKAQVADAVQQAESLGRPDPGEIFSSVYAEMPWHLREQKEFLLRRLAQRREGGNSHG